jgi:uncharacterized protein YbjQ (UPF0145 family)
MRKMKGTVCGWSSNRAFFALRTDYGYTVLEVHYGELEMGDVVSGDLDSHGSARFHNETQGGRIDGYVQAIQATREAAINLLNSV